MGGMCVDRMRLSARPCRDARCEHKGKYSMRFIACQNLFCVFHNRPASYPGSLKDEARYLNIELNIIGI